MTTEELLEQLEAEAQSETPVCVIDHETRTITVPPEYQLLGVENDKRVERIPFRCPKIVGDNQDLSQNYQLYINYQNANGDPDAYHIDDMSVEEDNITFSWLLEENVTKYKGSIKFAFGAIKPGDELLDPDKNRWNTTINTDCFCLVGLKGTQMVAESNPDALAQIWAAIDELKAGGGGGSYTLPIMSDTQLGGGKAISKTDEDVPVAVDPLTGQLFVPTGVENGYYYIEDLSEISRNIFSGDIKKVILFGDSITDGAGGGGYNGNNTNGYLNTQGYCWANLFKKILNERYGIQVDNYGKYGSVITEQYSIMQSQIPSGNYDMAIWLTGTNNRASDETYQSYKDTLPVVIDYLKSNVENIVIISCIPTSESDEKSKKHRSYEIDSVVLQNCYEKNVKYISGYINFLEFINNNDILLSNCFADGVHPNDVGYWAMFNVVCHKLNIALDAYINYKNGGDFWNSQPSVEPGGDEIFNTYRKGGTPFNSWTDGIIPIILVPHYNDDDKSTLLSGKTIQSIKINVERFGRIGTLTIGVFDLTSDRSSVVLKNSKQYTMSKDGVISFEEEGGLNIGNTETIALGDMSDSARLIYYQSITDEDYMITKANWISGQRIEDQVIGLPCIIYEKTS